MNKKKKRRLFLILDVALIALLGFGIFLFQKRTEAQDRAAVEQELERRYAPTITHNGEEAQLKRGLSTVLLIGTDNYLNDAKQIDPEIEAFYNENLADFLVVLVFDHQNQTVTPFQICRDTMCDVPWLSVNGLVGGTQWEQITLSHTYGSGKEDSCINTRNTVENLLSGVPVDHYLAFTMDTVPVANDLVGGVSVTLEDDIPALGSEYVKGNTVTLHGSDALRFVRYRDTSLLDDNLRRMGHHRQYLTGFAAAAREAAANNPDLITDGYRAVEKFLCTDLSVESFSDFINRLCDYDLQPAVTPAGAYRDANPFPEFIVDQDDLWVCVRSTFCKE